MKLFSKFGALGLPSVASVLALLFTGGAWATIIDHGDDIHISNVHHIEDDYYAFGERVTVDGLIDGDLVVGGNEVSTNGEVTESQNIFAYKFRHTGTVGNSLRAFAYNVEIDGHVGRSVILYAYDVQIGKGAVIERDANMGGYMVRLDGTVGGNTTIQADRIYLSGEIGGDVKLEGEQITISPPTVIKGDLTYTSKNEMKIDSISGVTVLGETNWKKPERKTDEEEEDHAGTGLRSFVLQVSKLLAAFLFGIIVIFVFRRHAQESFQQLRTRFAVSLATGSIALFVLVVAAITLVMSIIFVIVGLLLISGNLAPIGVLVLVLSILMLPITSFATVCGGIVFYSGKILFALLIGYLLVRLLKPEPTLLGKSQLLLGLIILALLFAIPYVGVLIYILVTIIGAGGIVLGVRKCRPATEPPPETGMPTAGQPR